MTKKDNPLTIVLATQNQHKVDEIRAILGDDIDYHTIGEYFDVVVQETGRSLRENSYTKAAFSYKVSGKASLADDSGLFVETLGGEPGIYSARYGADDQERITKLLKNLESANNRKAEFKAVFVYYYAPGVYEIFEGKCSGRIAREPRGTGGFGYDPIFIPKGYNKTFAELGPKVKNQISHRARALEKVRGYLRKHR